MEAVIALIALTVMEIVLGIDNIVFIAILTGRLPERQQALGRQLGLALALVTRIGLLLLLTVIMGLIEPIFHLSDLLSNLNMSTDWLMDPKHEDVNEVSWRDIILLIGGLFLIRQSVREIHEKLEDPKDEHKIGKSVSFIGVLAQIAALDVIFSLDSIITAVGMVDTGKDHPEGIWIMIIAIILAVVVMLIFAGSISRFVNKHPTLKMLALSFLILIGVMLVAESVGTPINKGYIYFAMAFALGVEMLNLRMKTKHKAKAKKAA